MPKIVQMRTETRDFGAPRYFVTERHRRHGALHGANEWEIEREIHKDQWDRLRPEFMGMVIFDDITSNLSREAVVEFYQKISERNLGLNAGQVVYGKLHDDDLYTRISGGPAGGSMSASGPTPEQLDLWGMDSRRYDLVGTDIQTDDKSLATCQAKFPMTESFRGVEK